MLTLEISVANDRSTNNERVATSALQFLLNVFVGGSASREACRFCCGMTGVMYYAACLQEWMDRHNKVFGYQTYDDQTECPAACTRVNPNVLKVKVLWGR